MKRFAFILCVCAGVALSGLASGQEETQSDAPQAQASQSLAQQLKEKPDDTALFNKYMIQNLGAVRTLIQSDTDKAEKQLNEMKALIESLEPKTGTGENLVGQAIRVIDSYGNQIVLARVTLDELVKKLKENPNDTKTISLYQSKLMTEIAPLTRTEPEKAEKLLKAAKELLTSVKEGAEEDAAKTAVERIERSFARVEEQIALARTTLDEFAAKLKANPNDTKTISLYQSKLMTEITPLTRTEPEKAEQLLNAAKELLTSVKEGVEEDTAKTAIERIERSFASVEKRIETGKRLAALVGSDAAPLEVEAWVNGEPLTDADLKGKVVLLDFWAVWCGPCIATFPHLIEWHEEYADKGLVIIGLTRYYQYTWDEEAGRAKRAPRDEEVTPEQEQEMLTKFAEQHNLHHRFAIQKDSTLSDYYAVSGIPHVVVIDREGKIRLFRIGSGDQNAKDISKMLEELVASE